VTGGEVIVARPLLELSRRDIALIFLPLAVLLAVAFWGVARYVQPAPPKVVVMSTGPIDGAYHDFAQRYKAVLAEYGVTLKLVASAGSVENLERLRNRQDGVSLALVQSGLANAENAPGLVTLGSVFYEPSWLFYSSKQTIELGNRLRGKRIAIGAPGSGTRAVALRVFRETGLAEPPTVLREIGGLAAAQALEQGEVDAVFYVAAPEAPGVQRLLTAPGVSLLSTKRAETFARRMPFLHKLTLPEGAIDFARDVPPRDVTLLAVTANLLAAEDVHPVIVELLLEAAKKVHGGPGLFQRLGEFPAPHDLDVPLSPDAERFYKSSPSALRRYLPFWAAVWINRFVFVAIPLLIIAIPIFRGIPVLYRWRMRRNIYRWYGELRFTENAVRGGEGDAAAQRARLERIEQQLDRMRVPVAYAAEFYILRSHVRWVRDLLREPRLPPTGMQ
jgi:TRAP transporter TAXI family solute receptor